MWIQLIIFLMVFCISTCAQSVPEQRLNLLSKGISIPHWYWMRFPDVLIPNYIQDHDIETLAKLGIKHVRIPFEMDDVDKPRITQHLKADIQRFVNHNIGVIVSAFGMKYNRDLISSSLSFKKIRSLCQILKDTPPDYVFLQFANEPLPDHPETWTTLQNKLIEESRRILPHHTLITSTPLKFDSSPEGWDTFKAFQAIPPHAAQNVVYAVDFYEPYLFTHQNADWDRNTRFIKQLAYPTDGANVRQLISKLPKNTPQWMIQSLHTFWDKEKLRHSLEPILAWRKKHQRPVIITEFGVYKPHVDTSSRHRWLTDVLSLFNEEKLLWTYWSYGGGFGLFNTNDGFRDLDIDVANILGFIMKD